MWKSFVLLWLLVAHLGFATGTGKPSDLPSPAQDKATQGYSQGHPPQSTPDTKYRQDQILVGFKDLGPSGKHRWGIEKLLAGESVDDAIARVLRNPTVGFAEPDYIVSLVSLPNPPEYDANPTLLWNLGKINAPVAWNLTTGNAVKVCVIDTGVDYFHPDLIANMDTTSEETRRGYNAIEDAIGAMDDNGHGTHVSGVIAGVGNNGGIAGLNWNSVKLLGCKFLDSGGSGSISAATRCVDWCVAQGASISSNSWGGSGFSQTFLNAVNDAEAELGHIFVVAAGNNAINVDSSPDPPYPCAYTTNNGLLTCVASTTADDTLSYFSNWGASKVHIGAPGSDIYSSVTGGTYATWSGTSMATPHVSGALALVKAVAGGELYLATIQNQAILRNIVLNKGDPIAALSGKTTTGKRLNVGAAVVEAHTINNLTEKRRTKIIRDNLQSGPAPVKPTGITAPLGPYPFNSGWRNLTVGDADTGQEVSIHPDWANPCFGYTNMLTYPSYAKMVYSLDIQTHPSGTNLTVDTCITSMDTAVSVLACNAAETTCTCVSDDDGCGLGGGGSVVSVAYNPTLHYKVIVYPFAPGGRGIYQLRVWDGASKIILAGMPTPQFSTLEVPTVPFTSSTTFSLGASTDTFNPIDSRLAQLCPNYLASRLVIMTYRKQIIEFSPFPAMVVGSYMEFNTCNRPSGTWDSVLGVLGCTKNGDGSLTGCTCYENDDSCGSFGSKLTNVIYETGKNYYAIVTSYASQTAGTYKPYINGQLASVTPPTCYSADTPCKKATQCCSKLCVAPPKRGPKVCV